MPWGAGGCCRRSRTGAERVGCQKSALPVSSSDDHGQPWGIMIIRVPAPVGCQNSATAFDQGFYQARSYSLMSPPGTGRRLIGSWEGPAIGSSGCGGRIWRLRGGGCLLLWWASYSAGSTAGGGHRRSASGRCLGPGDEHEPFGVGVRARLRGGIITALTPVLASPSRPVIR